MANLKIKFCDVGFENPTVLASGILGVTASSLKKVVKDGAGGVTTKSIWLEEHKGHSNPTMLGTENYFINAVGLSDAGIEKASAETFPEYLDGKSPPGRDLRPAPIIASIVASSIDDFGELAEKIEKCGPDIVEVNISCPNVEDEFGKPFACVADDAVAVTKLVKGKISSVPVIVKLSPNVESIGEIAKACADAGADGFCAVNTYGPGMVIDVDMRMPVLKNKVGGVSGPGIKPLAVKAVYDVFKATGLPIIGTGGVLSGEDAIEMMMAGARLVGMGTMVYYRGSEGFGEVVREMDEWCEKNGVKNIEEIIGIIK
ncbi:MAG: dihydroorotate dehydrogenase [Nitrospirae bacterium]|nr:dihydroorotate dehydrogenase [Nitrospirota bacterium]